MDIDLIPSEGFKKTIREQLLDLPDCELYERLKVERDYWFYRGKRRVPKEMAELNKNLMGQSWENNDNVDYEPTQEIRNKIKPLLKKQARWMFGLEPLLHFKPDNRKDKEECEKLRRWFDDVLGYNKFWNNTRKAFLEATIKKRVLLRVEANPGKPVSIKYESIENFYYEEKNGRLMRVDFFVEDSGNAYREDTKKIYFLHSYYYELDEESQTVQTIHETKKYKNTNLLERKKEPTGFSVIPCWLIKNEGELNSDFGESDVEDIIDSQNEYNRTVSDTREALKFMMFGAETVIDGDEDDVNSFIVAPNAIHAVQTSTTAIDAGKQASINRSEYKMSSYEAIDKYLKRCEDDMNSSLDMPRISDLSSIPSAKAMIYLYNDLIARCDEKFTEWNEAFLEMINFILEVAVTCYPAFEKNWLKLNYTLVIERRNPLSSYEDNKKDIALREVQADVRSHYSYIEDFSAEEDVEAEWQRILDEKKDVTDSETDSFEAAATAEYNDEIDSNKDFTK